MKNIFLLLVALTLTLGVSAGSSSSSGSSAEVKEFASESGARIAAAVREAQKLIEREKTSEGKKAALEAAIGRAIDAGNYYKLRSEWEPAEKAYWDYFVGEARKIEEQLELLKIN